MCVCVWVGVWVGVGVGVGVCMGVGVGVGVWVCGCVGVFVCVSVPACLSLLLKCNEHWLSDLIGSFISGLATSAGIHFLHCHIHHIFVTFLSSFYFFI